MYALKLCWRGSNCHHGCQCEHCQKPEMHANLQNLASKGHVTRDPMDTFSKWDEVDGQWAFVTVC